MNAVQQWATLLRQNLRAEFASKERVLSPMLFAMTVLILFWFAFGELPESEAIRAYVAETFLAAFFALQLSFTRIFDPEQRDGAFDLMRTYPLSPTAWFVAKLCTIWLTGGMVLVAAMLLGAFFHGQIQKPLIDGVVLLIGLAALLGLGSVGLLLAGITMRSSARQVLFPLIYFPLTVPILLAATQSAQAHIVNEVTLATLMESWVGLLLAFDVIYLSLGLLLYDQLLFED